MTNPARQHTPRQSRWRKRLQRIFRSGLFRNLRAGFGIAFLLLLAGLLLARSTDSLLSWPHNSLARLVVILLVILLIVLIVFQTSDIVSPDATALGRPVPRAPTADEIAQELRWLYARYDEAALNLFAGILAGIPHYLYRVNEHAAIEADGPRLRLTTYLDFDLRHSYHGDEPRSEQESSPIPDVLILPFVWLASGTLLDDFSVTDADGSHLSTLSYNQSRGLVAYALSLLFEMANRDVDTVDEKVTRSRASTDRATVQNALVRRLVAAMCAPGPLAKQSGRERESRESAMNGVDVFPISDVWRDRIKSFCRQYMDNYFIVVEVPGRNEPHLGISYTHCVPLDSPTSYPFNQWRERFGLNPSTIDVVPSPFFLQVQAYHLEIYSQPDQYVFDHHLEYLESNVPVVQEQYTGLISKPYIRVYHEEGRPNAHLYVRPQEISNTANVGGLSRVKSIVQFREIPPGALGGATAVAFASAVIISFFALTRLGLATAGGTGPAPSFPTDIPALLLALPGFVTVLFGSWIELSRLRRASLTTYLALVGTMCFSLVASLYYLYSSVRPVKGTFSLYMLNSHVAITTDAGWLILMTVSVTHFLFLFRQVVSELKYYGNCIRRRTLRQT